jgi:acetyl esterase/lipase
MNLTFTGREGWRIAPEDVFVELFAQVFGVEKVQPLAHAYPIHESACARSPVPGEPHGVAFEIAQPQALYVSKDTAPFLIVYGDQDNLVPLAQSEALAEALKKAGVEVNLVVIKGNGHGGPGFTNLENRKLIEEFFAKHLRKEKP